MMSYEPRRENPKIMDLVNRVEKETILVDGNECIEWAIKSMRLVGKAFRKHQKFEAFYDIIMNGSKSNRCCHMVNDRLQGDRGRMNLFVLRLFRFPWLRYYTQIKSNNLCRHRYDRHGTMACMNPWHYDCIEVPMPSFPAVVVNRQADFGELPREVAEDTEFSDSNSGVNVSVRGDELNHVYKLIECKDLPPSIPLDGAPQAIITGRVQVHNGDDDFPRFDVKSMEVSPDHSPLHSDVDMSETSEELQNSNVVNETNGDETQMVRRWPKRYNDEPNIEGVCYAEEVIKGYDAAVGKWERALEHRSLPQTEMDYECIEYTEVGDCWAQITYYEEADNIGNTMKASTPNFLIDGYTSAPSSSDRMSLGYFTNVNRTKLTADLRKSIGHGIRIYYLGGDVFVESLCEQPIFIQSYNTNLRCDFAVNAVIKMAPFNTMKVFSMKQFAAQLSAAADKTYQDVFALSRTSGFRISFCKGWGEQYRRSTVVRAPCWVQVMLPGPKQWLDNVLECMGVPMLVCGSRS